MKSVIDDYEYIRNRVTQIKDEKDKEPKSADISTSTSSTPSSNNEVYPYLGEDYGCNLKQYNQLKQEYEQAETLDWVLGEYSIG